LYKSNSLLKKTSALDAGCVKNNSSPLPRGKDLGNLAFKKHYFIFKREIIIEINTF